MTCDARKERPVPLAQVDLTQTIRRNVSARLVWLLRNRNMSQRELASASGVSKTVISRIVARQRTVTADALVRLCLALDVNPAWLLGFNAGNKPRSASGKDRTGKENADG